MKKFQKTHFYFNFQIKNVEIIFLIFTREAFKFYLQLFNTITRG